jgi:hypothetical protein
MHRAKASKQTPDAAYRPNQAIDVREAAVGVVRQFAPCNKLEL